MHPGLVMCPVRTSTCVGCCYSHYSQSQPIIGIRWSTTIFGCLSSLPAVFPASSVMGDNVTRVTRSLLKQREREHC